MKSRIVQLAYADVLPKDKGCLSIDSRRSFSLCRRLKRDAFLLVRVGIFLISLSLALVLKPDSARATSSILNIPGGGVVQLSADTLERDFSQSQVILNGNVKVMFNQQFISCDRAVISEKKNEIETYGNLVISSPQAYIEGDAAVLNYKDNTSVIQNGFVKSGQILFEGAVVRKVGPDTYESERASFTACTTCPAAWSFSGSKMSAQLGGYAHIKNPFFEVATVPVFWLPYLIVPLKSERQTGLLVPTIDISNGPDLKFPFLAAMDIPFFWAISRSQDATFTLRPHARRGLKFLSEYRYVLTETSSGLARMAVTRDPVFAQQPAVMANPGGGRNLRWFANYKHEYELPGGFSQRTKLNLVSDLWYPRDFRDEMPYQGDPALENRVSLTKNFEHLHTSIDADYYVNLLKANPLSDNRDSVHRWPELRLSLTDQPLLSSNLQWRFNANYVNFARNTYGFDDVIAKGSDPGTGKSWDRQVDEERDGDAVTTNPNNGRQQVGGAGSFNPSLDLIRSGQRLDVSPEISYPISAGPYLDIMPSAQFRYTQYAFAVTKSPGDQSPYDLMPSRQYLRASISARTTLSRVYGDDRLPQDEGGEKKSAASSWISDLGTEGSDPAASAREANTKVRPRPDIYRHEILPEITANYIPFISQPANHPFFKQGAQVAAFLEDQPVSDDNFFNPDNGLQFDYYDRLANRTLLTASVTNRLVRKRWRGDSPDYRQIANLKIGQSYDIDEAKRETPPSLPYSDIFAKLDLTLERLQLASTVRYYPYHRVANSDSMIRIQDWSGSNFFQINFTQKFNIFHEIEKTTPDQPALRFTVGFISKYFDLKTALNLAPIDYTRSNYQLMTLTNEARFKPPGNCWGIRMYHELPVLGDRIFRIFFDFNFSGM